MSKNERNLGENVSSFNIHFLYINENHDEKSCYLFAVQEATFKAVCVDASIGDFHIRIVAGHD